MTPPSRPRDPFLLLVLLTAVNAAYLAAFDSATIFYHVNVLAHVALGLLLVVALVYGAARRLTGRHADRASRAEPPGGVRDMTERRRLPRRLVVLYAAAATVMSATGLFLTKVGTSRPHYPWLRVHEGAAVLFVLVLAGALAIVAVPARRRILIALGLLAFLPAAVRLGTAVRPAYVSTIVNPPLPPRSPQEEGGGAASPFFPSSNKTASGALIRSDFFLESRSCGNKGCHPDITAQWESSAHHFSSFNNQWYRKSVEYMQDTIGTRPSKWCGGCHDMAILLTGRMDTPIRQQIHTPEAQAGIGCLVCHSIVDVHDTMGQGGFTLEYPEMHRLVASKNPVLSFLHDRMVLLDPGPHKATMLKPFHRSSTPEFCSSCHKVHLDVPVNSYRWFRGFNEYDPWQQSGVSGQGARAFYYPPDGPKKCGSCHMPLVASQDKGNVDGKVHSHRFPGANTALPFANHDEVQLEAVTKFLQDGILTVDIFAVSEDPELVDAAAPRPGARVRAGGDVAKREPGEGGSIAASSMIPEEGGTTGLLGGESRPRDVIAPLERAGAAARPGSTVRVDVVARTRKVGHFFPGGTVDAFDVWLELQAQDADGRVLFWNGWVADDGHGPVDPGAHFYRSVLVDDHGNRINKRNAWAARAVAYARLIPPGAADTAHFRLRLPADVKGPLKLTARMNYRKFSWWNTQWAFAGVRDPREPSPAVAARYDDGHWVFQGDTSDVSGEIKGIPDLPTIVVAQDTKLLAVGAAPEHPAPLPADRERWTDYGIGLLLQKDYKGADAAFTRVTEIEPGYADGWVNRARVAVEEGDHRRAIELCDRALAVDPKLAKAHYFRGIALRTFGRYDEALADLTLVTAAFPRDRVVWNAIGRVRFLQRRYLDAIEAFRKTLAIDPEDVTAHYNLMLCARGLHDEAMAKLEEGLYARFKADESAQAVTGDFRRLNPDDNRERQAIHEHDSTWTPENLAAASAKNYAAKPAPAPPPTPPPAPVKAPAIATAASLRSDSRSTP